MALFGGGGKKKACSFCGGKAGFLNSKTLTDGERICDDCAADASPYANLAEFDTAGVNYQREVHQRMSDFLDNVGTSVDATTLPRWGRYKGIKMGSVTLYPDLGMFLIRDFTKKHEAFELFRFDHLVSFSPKTEDPLMHKSNPGELHRVGFEVKFANHPYLTKLEQRFAQMLKGRDVDQLVTDANELASEFDQVLGIVEVAGLATSVAGAFGVRADIARKVGPQYCPNLPELSKRADEAIQRWGQIW